ncbi:DNA-protecting protein DprA [Candidatus Saccharibacteria bacterium CG11_big_fil_rev_8_21_14_0_20_41_19]|nr:DNA-protecting protein DprA [Candidatus Saccharibacteria bacterium]OIP85796.1 MAG: DNA protecting protein DprA [Candidatus Saccharibacteria bacterium CG2_30_41_52]PIQ70912.1 MAG: DNA-protecting protein DprA [Candidatus Saccharibacteria bacterium CG11_big_fil_rev_8_21_14_0_20_41_19]PIZ61173.1 MAG: DNA-protecting protein DprA [Candidatus Saccharibacteria bacterium CG_4_10_14_0_2_um_filter_41_11]PJC29991.1 MAG: DNA-protecting protein DprA [Candidatus Saccharibacteria bacterium CG_4_9_14_0_2_um_
MKINTISPQDNNYLQIISTIANPPKKFYFIGKLPEKRTPTVAIIGSRKPTAYGKEVTYQLAYDLARHGIIIVSGLALGVDGLAHRATIDAGGKTIAVMANGVDIIYPAAHMGLSRDILGHGGAIVSEYEPGVEARDFQFLDRNRIVSGLSDAIIVTEAAARSGTLSTVMHALEQGREVFVVPGNITSPLSAGCNNLIKQGAHPITCANDVIEIIAPSLLQTQSLLPLGSTPLESKIIGLLQSGIRDGEELQTLSEVNASEFSCAITMMEISSTIRALGGNQWTLKR